MELGGGAATGVSWAKGWGTVKCLWWAGRVTVTQTALLSGAKVMKPQSPNIGKEEGVWSRRGVVLAVHHAPGRQGTRTWGDARPAAYLFLVATVETLCLLDEEDHDDTALGIILPQSLETLVQKLKYRPDGCIRSLGRAVFLHVCARDTWRQH